MATENDRHLREVQAIARGIDPPEDDLDRRMGEAVVQVRQATAEIRQHLESLEDSVSTLRERRTTTGREPTATVELTEEELNYLIAVTGPPGVVVAMKSPPVDFTRAVSLKLSQALAIEQGAGGRFVDPA